MGNYFTIWDVFLSVVYFTLIMVVTYFRNRYTKDPLKKQFYSLGLMFKLFASIAFCLIYVFYYGGVSDSLSYFENGKSLANMFSVNTQIFFKVFFGDTSPEVMSHFGRETGGMSRVHDSQTFAIKRFTAPFVLLGAKSLLSSTLLMAAFFYNWIFRLFAFLVDRYKNVNKFHFFIAVVIMPSSLFWASGIMKDTITFAAVCLAAPSLFYIINKKKIIANIFLLIIGCYFLFAIKPYLLFGLIAGVGFAFLIVMIRGIKIKILRYVVFPVFLVGLYAFSLQITTILGASLGGFYASPEDMLGKAQEVQQDLIRDQYGDNSFDIGYFDASISGIVSKIPEALLTGLFRPFLWEARSVMVLFSALENMVLLLFSLYVLLKYKLRKLIRLLSDPFLGFCFVFSLSIAFMVGLSTANFGALVRYKIPLIPFYATFLVYVFARIKETKDIDNVK